MVPPSTQYPPARATNGATPMVSATITKDCTTTKCHAYSTTCCSAKPVPVSQRLNDHIAIESNNNNKNANNCSNNNLKNVPPTNTITSPSKNTQDANNNKAPDADRPVTEAPTATLPNARRSNHRRNLSLDFR